MATSSTKSELIRDPNTIFTCDEIKRRLRKAKGRTLEEVDVNNAFGDKFGNKGVAGHVIEKSVLGYSLNNKSEPDILIDGKRTEVKTTGMKKVKGIYVAKEPLTITGVLLDKGLNEDDFEKSHFWAKAYRILLVYYHYDYKGPYNVQEYRHFVILGSKLNIMTDEDKAILKADWSTVESFVNNNPPSNYPEISHLSLMYLDTAPKYLEKNGKVKQEPRFRFKRSYVDVLIHKKAGDDKPQLSFKFDKYSDFDNMCDQLTSKYKGMTVFELIHKLQIFTKSIHKAISERIVLKMFGSDVQKINDIVIFNKLGLIGKTLVQSASNGRTEDMKLFKIDFDEIKDTTLKFEDSQFYSYFHDKQILAILFQEQTKKDVKFEENTFIGFKRISFSEEFIENEVRPVWLEIRRLVNDKELREVFVYNKDGTKRLTPKTKVPVSAPNFPKSEDNIVFVRGSGVDKSNLPENINGIKMLAQYLWIRGREMNNAVNGKISF